MTMKYSIVCNQGNKCITEASADSFAHPVVWVSSRASAKEWVRKKVLAVESEEEECLGTITTSSECLRKLMCECGGKCL